jgi:hypothetical protein
LKKCFSFFCNTPAPDRSGSPEDGFLIFYRHKTATLGARFMANKKQKATEGYSEWLEWAQKK